MRALIPLLAARSGQLLVAATLGNELGLAKPAIKRYLSLPEEVFLIKRLRAWSRNLGTRSVSAPESRDGRLLDCLQRAGPECRHLAPPGSALGPLPEAFAALELGRQLTWSQQRAEMYRYRTGDQV
jgi:predicted AAA+ superfamily ATPase